MLRTFWTGNVTTAQYIIYKACRPNCRKQHFFIVVFQWRVHAGRTIYVRFHGLYFWQCLGFVKVHSGLTSEERFFSVCLFRWHLQPPWPCTRGRELCINCLAYLTKEGAAAFGLLNQGPYIKDPSLNRRQARKFDSWIGGAAVGHVQQLWPLPEVGLISRILKRLLFQRFSTDRHATSACFSKLKLDVWQAS